MSKLAGLALFASHWKQITQELRGLDKQPEILIVNQGVSYVVRKATMEDKQRLG